MSTLAPPTTLHRGDQAGIPFTRLVRVELRKLYDTRAGRWLLIAMAATTVILVVVMWFAATVEDQTTFDDVVQAVAFPQALLLPVLGVLSVTSEWSQRTGLTTFTLEPRRGRVLAAKVAAAGVAALAVGAVVIVVAIAGYAVGTAAFDWPGVWSFGVTEVLDLALGQLLNVLAGIAFGVLFLNSAAAITLYYVLPLIWSVLTGLIDALDGVARWADMNRTSSPLWEFTIHGVQWARLAVSALVWIGVPLAIGIWRVLRAEIKSA